MQQKKAAHWTPLAPHVWSGAPAQRVLQRLNKRIIQMLVEAVQAGPVTLDSPAVSEIRKYVEQLDDHACERIARCPALLVDLKFQQSEWWDSVEHSPPESMHLNSPQPVFTQAAGSKVLGEILLEARSMACTAPHEVSLLFGMAPGVLHVVAKLSCEDALRVTEQHARYLRPRWEDRRVFWRQLLRAAVDVNDEKLIDVQLHGLALLGGELTLGRK